MFSLLGSACGGAAVALGLVGLFCLPADSPDATRLNVIGLGLAWIAILAVVALAVLDRRRRARPRG